MITDALVITALAIAFILYATAVPLTILQIAALADDRWGHAVFWAILFFGIPAYIFVLALSIVVLLG